MTEQEFERLSALVDDELPESEISGEINKLTQNPSSRDIWSRYHLIGDAMRSELGTLHHTGIAQAISSRLEDEPVVLAPAALKRSARPRKRALTGLAVAASLAAVAVVMAPQMINPEGSEAPQQALAVNRPPETKTLYVAEDGTRWELLKKPKVESRLNAYLVNHQEFSPSSNIKGIMPFATFVSYDENKQ
ncbi:MAG: sigma-E factor negative regulatory protein [Candidatus Thiodiazotropha sp. (ex Dulcina madagascariensis)]|nr:sigma-E factor negative regulatory protein [Candidatus Thiodiazotropha sp. (ex Dulcina madagascariensis)]MCU7926300.1 sigma-E factor negative regulatory protein [Candidatus Thiodiazotropha sp. (ex Dulcina madagascariensis)]